MHLLTIRDTAERLKVSPMTVRRFIADGRLAAVRVGRGVRVREEELEQLLAPIVPETALAAPEDEQVPRGKALSYDDPMWQLVGSITHPGPDDVSERVDEYLADADLPAHP